jgi:hypothetical protein
MLPFKPIDECENKTLKKSFKTINDGGLILIFENCYSSFTVDAFDDQSCIINQQINLINHCYEEDLIENNLVTQEDINNYYAEKTQSEERREYQTFLRLKEKYDPS